MLVLSNGIQVAIPRVLLQGLEHAKPEQLRKIEIEGPGSGLHWPALGIDHYIPALLDGVFGTHQWMSELGKAHGHEEVLDRVAVETQRACDLKQVNHKKRRRCGKEEAARAIPGDRAHFTAWWGSARWPPCCSPLPNYLWSV